MNRQRMIGLGGLFGIGILILILPNSRFWFAALVCALAPGYLLERWLDLDLAPLVRPSLWIGLSLAVWPLGYLWLTTLGLALSTGMITLIAFGLMSGVVWRLWRETAQPWFLPAPLPILGLALLIIGLTISTRIEHISNLAFPPWVDSLHHATIMRVIAESGQVPYSLRPYMPVDNFGYHWGFHATAATIYNLSGMSIPQFMLWYGQFLGVLVVISVGSATIGLTKSPIAGLAAATMTGFISIMPAYYLSWGRYTLLSGLAMVPVVLLLAWVALDRPDRKGLILLTIVVGGLLPTHFVAAGCALLWCVAVWLGRDVWTEQRWQILGKQAAAVGMAILLMSPWLALLIREIQPAGSGTPKQLVGGGYNTFEAAKGLYFTWNNVWLLRVSMLAALVGFWRQWRLVLISFLWAGLVMLFANPVVIGLPYLSFFNNNIVALAIFLPISLWLALGVASLDQGLSQYLSLGFARSWRAIRTIILALTIVISAAKLHGVTNDGTIIAKADDLTALNWIVQRIPKNARFAINTEGWLYNVARGSDGGWWILPYVGLQVSTPPVVYNQGTPEYIKAVEAETSWLRNANEKTASELAQWMREHNYDYAYATTNGKIFNQAKLANVPEFELVYENASVAIYLRR
ncbi:hypothetical protein [Herpetosiphon gulosus]|uniref:Glycosyltransferase RgtA/B/C/D-like domain-containing protein n=1 Tax=Herpetosiphon gulosus TaxID=1973496 RepID=A0ABP9X4Y6_9CHLR